MFAFQLKILSDSTFSQVQDSYCTLHRARILLNENALAVHKYRGTVYKNHSLLIHPAQLLL